jgi:selenoprotein W-related protein
VLTEYKQKITDLKLIPAGGGAFELTIDGELVYSKLQTDEFPDEAAVLEMVGARLKKKKK